MCPRFATQTHKIILCICQTKGMHSKCNSNEYMGVRQYLDTDTTQSSPISLAYLAQRL